MIKLKNRINFRIIEKDFGAFVIDGTTYFSAKEVGEIIGYSMPNINKMVSKVDEEEKKQFIMETRGKHVNSRNRPQWFLTKDGLFEMLFQSRKEVAKQFKKEVKRVLKELDKNGYYIATEKDALWIGARQDGKEVRKTETDTIKEFVEYAKEQGSSKPNWYYKHFTNLVRNKLKLEKGLKRDDMTQKTLLEIQGLETVISMKLNNLLKTKDLEYKEMYKEIKKMIEEI